MRNESKFRVILEEVGRIALACDSALLTDRVETVKKF